MKRYLMFMITVVFTFTAIGGLYVKQAVAMLPEYSLEHVKGDKEYAERITFHGSIVNEKKGYDGDFRIVNNETLYRHNDSFLDRLFGYRLPKFDSLIGDYRNFMRGKEDLWQYFYEDEERLIYANMIGSKALKLKLEILDKKTKKSKSYEIDHPEQGQVNYSYVEEVQFNGKEQVWIIVRNHYYNREGTGEEYRLYTFNLNKEKLTDNDVIFAISSADESWLDIHLNTQSDDLGKEKYILFERERRDPAYLGHDETNHFAEISESNKENYLIYNLETKESKSFQLPDEMMNQAGKKYLFLHNSTLYIGNQFEERFQITAYDIEKETFGEPVVFDGIEEMQTIYFYKDVVYFIYSRANKRATVYVKLGNMNTGDVLYEGIIKNSGKKKADLDDRVYIHNMSVYE